MILLSPDLYQMLPSWDDGMYFGAFPDKDFGRLSPDSWFHRNHGRFILSLDVISAARKPYEREAGPDTEGIYFLYAQDELVYVGQSVEISTRLHTHCYPAWPIDIPAGWFTHYAAIWVPKRFLDDVERYYIHLLQPKRNIQYLRPPPLGRFYLQRARKA